MRKILRMALCVLLCLSLLTVPVLAEGEVLSIGTAEELLNFAENCRLDSYSKDLSVQLTADIDLSDKDFEGIPIFYGSFDGGGHTVSGVNITASGSNMGFFRYVAAGASVSALHISGTVAPGGDAGNVGGIVGSNAGLLTNCSFSGEVTGTDNIGSIAGVNGHSGIVEGCGSKATVYGDHFVGGIVGANSGVIRACKNEGSVNTTEKQNKVDISNITVDALTGTESTMTVTDIGGIAGTSSGVIRGCENTGDVGYPHMGYNIGGIAGSQAGFLTECINSGSIHGRKDVGGIVGQLEPNTTLFFDEDTLQILDGQLKTLSVLTDKAKANAGSTSAALSEQIAILENQITDAKDAADRLLPEKGTVPDPDSVIAAGNDLGNSLTQMQSTLQTIEKYTGSGASTLVADIQGIAGQLESIEQTLGSGEENIQTDIADISDLDTEEDTSGKVSHCTNTGAVQGDRNVGGIAGTINFENDLDPDSDIDILGELSLNQSCDIRAVIRSCSSNAAITGKKQNTGGIAGAMYLGLVRECAVTGSITADSGEYTGGIAGNAVSGFIRNCLIKAPITGSYCVGGIAGSATVVTSCLSMTHLTGVEAVGAVLGKAEELTQITGNYYLTLEKDPGAIDGISYEGHGQAMSLEAFLALEDLPEMFKTNTVTFRFPDGTEETLTLPQGTSPSAEQIPSLPEQNGAAGVWTGENGEDLNNILFDAVFTASYTSLPQVLQSSNTGENGNPLMLAQGTFLENAVLTVEKGDSRDSIECWCFAVSEGSELSVLRLMLPDGYSAKDITLQLCDLTGLWRDVTFTVDGSYLVFSVDDGDIAVRLLEAPANYTIWILAGAGVLVIAGVNLWILLLRRRRKAKKKTETIA